jgi:hypothetical protein
MRANANLTQFVGRVWTFFESRTACLAGVCWILHFALSSFSFSLTQKERKKDELH